MERPRNALLVGMGAGVALAALAAAGQSFDQYGEVGGTPRLSRDWSRDPEPSPYASRRWKRRNPKRYTGGRYKGSTAAKRATKRGGNPAAQR